MALILSRQNPSGRTNFALLGLAGYILSEEAVRPFRGNPRVGLLSAFLIHVLPRCRISGSVFPAGTMIRRLMDFLRVAVELASPVHGPSVGIDAGVCNGVAGKACVERPEVF